MSDTDLDLLLEREGFANVVPEAESAEECKEMLRASPEWNGRSEEGGVLAVRVRSTKRKS